MLLLDKQIDTNVFSNQLRLLSILVVGSTLFNMMIILENTLSLGVAIVCMIVSVIFVLARTDECAHCGTWVFKFLLEGTIEKTCVGRCAKRRSKEYYGKQGAFSYLIYCSRKWFVGIALGLVFMPLSSSLLTITTTTTTHTYTIVHYVAALAIIGIVIQSILLAETKSDDGYIFRFISLIVLAGVVHALLTDLGIVPVIMTLFAVSILVWAGANYRKISEIRMQNVR